ncbi:MAG TPA: hypothetical protein VLM43_19585 [Desulfobacterales bacterium]|nr:hypothetical protein [Desulfobacterales bacterium]
MSNAVSFSGKRVFGIVIIFVFVFGLTMGGCGGFMKKKEQPAEKPAAEQKGSLSHTYKVIDDQGRNAGTLILDISGSAVLKDADGKVIGTFKPTKSVEVQPSEVQQKPQPGETQSELEKQEAQPKTETTEVQSEPKKSEVKSEPEASETQSQKKE